MPSPITSADFDLSNFSGDVCDQVTQLVGLSAKLKAFFAWAFDASGNPTDAFKRAMAIVPVGNLMFRPVSSIPEGWLLCNGQAVSRADYADLYAIIGTKFGAGNATTTFNLPDLSGLFPLGAGAGFSAGDLGGESEVELLPEHTQHMHGVGTDGGVDDPAQMLHRNWISAFNQIQRGNDFNVSSHGWQDFAAIKTGVMGTTEAVADPNIASTGHNNMPPYMAGLWLIKF